MNKEPRSGERIQPTAQAVGRRRENDRSPSGAKENLQNVLKHQAGEQQENNMFDSDLDTKPQPRFSCQRGRSPMWLRTVVVEEATLRRRRSKDRDKDNDGPKEVTIVQFDDSGHRSKKSAFPKSSSPSTNAQATPSRRFRHYSQRRH